MAIYSIGGTQLVECYDFWGSDAGSAYDINGIKIFEGDSPDIPVTPKSWNMSNDYKTQVLSALDTIRNYQEENESAYSICQFNDAHDVFDGNEPNFIDYNRGYKVLSRMIFLGDIADTAGVDEYSAAVDFMTGASASKRIIGMGNHEYGNVGALDPESVYRAAMNVSATFMTNSALIFYHDDQLHNVRYVVLDYFYISRTHYDNGHILDSAQLDWCADVMADSGNKDIIICAHSMINPFVFPNTQEQKSSSATIQYQQDIIDLITAYKNRGSYSVTINGTVHTHDFSECTGNFIMYTSGHYHALGYNNFGFNMFTCPSLKSAYGTGQYKGFTFYIIDPDKRKIKLLSIKKDEASYLPYDFTY